MKRIFVVLALLFLIAACSNSAPEEDYLEENVTALNNLGFYYASQGDNAKAKHYFTKVLDIQMDHEVARKNLALIYFEEQNYTEAEKHFRMLTQMHPDNPQYHYNIGVILANKCRNMGECDQLNIALEEFNTSENLEPGYEEAVRNMEVIRSVMADMNNTNSS